MGHLKPEQLIDLAEAGRPETDVPHLASCAECRRRLDDLRSTLKAAAEVDVPEPSPLFWDHLSARVRESIASEEPHRGRVSWPGWSLPISIGAFAAIVLAAALAVNVGRSNRRAPMAIPDAVIGAGAALDDPSLDLVADMTADVEWDSPSDLGLTTTEGSVERAVVQLSDEERVELHRLLEAELKRPGN